MRKVKYSRTTDKYVSLNERARLANVARADYFISVHTNSFTLARAKGVETFSFPGSSKGRILSSAIQNSILSDRSLYTVNRGIKTANFAVLRNTRMPSALTELAFISNVDDAKILRNKQKQLARKIADAIIKETGSNDTVFLDAGHGGKDPGAVGNGLKEKDITLAVVLEVGRLLKGGVDSKPNAPSRPVSKPVKKPVVKPKPVKNKLVVDGSFGPATVKELQRQLNTKVDGIISGQYPNGVTRQIPSVSFSGRYGSNVIRALQRKIGAKVDGYIGVGTVRALQKYLGTPVDGIISNPSMMVRELQRRLNSNNL